MAVQTIFRGKIYTENYLDANEPYVWVTGTLPSDQDWAGVNPSLVVGITAHAGGTQAAAVLLTGGVNQVTVVATNGDSVILPKNAVFGQRVVVINAGAHTLDVYPQPGGTINGGSVNAANTQATTVTLTYLATSNLNWISYS